MLDDAAKGNGVCVSVGSEVVARMKERSVPAARAGASPAGRGVHAPQSTKPLSPSLGAEDHNQTT